MTNPILGVLADEITQTRGVMQSAIVLVNGISARIETAIAAAVENGATAEELAPFTELEAALEQDRQALAAAVATQG